MSSGQELRNFFTNKNLEIYALYSGFENYFYPMAWDLEILF